MTHQPSALAESATLKTATSTGGRRKSSRFAPAPTQEDEDDPMVPDEFKIAVPPKPEPTTRPRERSRESIRDRDRDERLPRLQTNHRDSQISPTALRRQERSPSPAADDAPTGASQRKRQPLPPQAQRFREARIVKSRYADEAPRMPVPTRERDPPPHTDRGGGAPSAPRGMEPPVAPLSSRGRPRSRSRSPDRRDRPLMRRLTPSRSRSRERSRERQRPRSRSRSRERQRSRERERPRDERQRDERPRDPPRRERSPDRRMDNEPPKAPRAMEHANGTNLPPPPLSPTARTGRPGRPEKPRRGRRVREIPAATGTNNIPVGVRQPSEVGPKLVGPVSPVAPPPPGISSANLVPLKNRSRSGYGTGAPDGDFNDAPPPPRMQSPPRRPVNPEREVVYNDVDRDKNGYPPNKARRLSPVESRPTRERSPRRWGPREREPSPGYRDDRGRGRDRDLHDDYRDRPATPPPMSREPSHASPLFDDRAERRSVRNGDSHEDLRNAPENGSETPAQQNGYKMQHPLPMNPKLLRMGPSSSLSPQLSRRERSRSPPPPAPEPTAEPLKPSKPPIKIRRPPPISKESSLPELPMVVDPEPQRPPNMRRGGSLLDRLSDAGPNGEDPSLSLRDRVQVPLKRDRDDMVDSMLEDRIGGASGHDIDGPGGKRRKRSGKKPRRRGG
ncbi:hypothetical protein VNI00_006225 [Paramarasmius palmivorus]|uniref:Uncharacterized protein n=1 Tax=Paramarasmius palmivorus TaxID=297713 RepID=A0AAW0D8K4_9AGAR